jgi:uncharacterized SAM-binding protein YcdF (DUF218 family)
MQAVVDLFKANWRLGAPLLILATFGIGVVLLYFRRLAPWGRRWLTACSFGYWFLATPAGSGILSGPLVRAYEPIASREQAKGAQAVVIIGGGIVTQRADSFAVDDLAASALRMIEGARLYRLLGEPLMIVSGGNTGKLEPPRPEAEAFRTALVQLGVPWARIVVEDQSRTTREQAVRLKDVLGGRHIEQFVLVTGPEHMPRSVAAFRAVGLDPIPSPARLRPERDKPSWMLMPDRGSLGVSDGAIYEYLGLAYYRMRGWIGTP